MPIFGYQCSECGRVEDRFFGTLADRDTYEEPGPKSCKPGANLKNRKCPGLMKRQLSAPNFKVNGYCAANGYEFNGTQKVNKGVV